MSTAAPSVSVTCTAPVNIAVIKYWGKRDEQLILPLNESLSGTLNQDDMCSKTTVTASTEQKEDEIWLNGNKEDISATRLQNVLRAIRAKAADHVDADGKVLVTADQWPQYKVKIVSENNFPTAAGLASSASGYCCLVFALAQVFGVKGDVSAIARQGSGSACRSMYGGFVAWRLGEKEDGSDSLAEQICDEKHWDGMQVLVLVANDAKKDVGSSVGMQISVKTSPTIHNRAEVIVPQRMKEMEEAIAKKDFQAFGDLSMKDSDDFHAVCADTVPPIHYLSDASRSVISLIHQYNAWAGKIQAAYTFDAGPNAVIYLPKEFLVETLALVLSYFSPGDDTTMADFVRDAKLLEEVKAYTLPKALVDSIKLDTPPAGSLKYILHTTIGDGPRVL
eukprot:TRINITY_DN4115_c0_g1_i1.p1 TRINITY_DN4115_c0_g1~~TRINITY_DN4115_c0_g1_i1.p1  ORF type:complete len:401 (-),score=112.04 TRINITY_DN4115_c0_g1_i1:351-1526(-)